jgi:hypothetical protein
MAKKLKDILKTNPEPAIGKVGINPMDPWSAKANISEDGSLGKYLLSRGINPKFVSRDTKISHAKSSAFLKWKQDHQFEELEHLDEDALLDKFLSSRGINPKFVTRDIKISYAKSGEFTKWKRDHMFEEIQLSETDQADVICVDIPLMIRLLELAREDVKDDMELHKITERLIEIRNNGTLTMADYDFIANGKAKIKEEVQIDEAKKPKLTALDRWRAAAAEREKKHNDIEKARQEKLHQDPSKVTVPVANTKKDDLTLAIDRLERHLNKEEVEQIDELNYDTVKSLYNKRRAMRDKPSKKSKEVKVKNVSTSISRMAGYKTTQNQPFDKIDKGTHYELKPKNEEVEQIDELKKSTMASYKDKSTASLKNAQANRDAAEPGKDMSKGFADLHAKSDKIVKNRVKGLIGYMQRKQGMKPTSENTLDPLAATEAPCDGANGGETTDRQRQMSKSARMIKSLYKHLNMKEETYDWEKDDKSIKSYGKSPKVNKTEDKDNVGENKPEARIVMSGGKTLTGEKRDTVEIDPLMKNRPDLNGNIKSKQ